MKRTSWLASLLFLLAALLSTNLLTLGVTPAAARLSSGSELVQAVNRLRRNNGLPAYQVNNILMAVAQAHSDYQASIGSVTHTGPGGSRPRDRALAAGYGGGGTIFISENIAGGRDLSAQGAVQWWQGDAPHLNTMLSPNYQDVGAGAATAGGVTYYTLDAAYIAGAAAPPANNTAAPGTAAAVIPGPTAVAIIPVQAATPKPDGSIIHVVQQGQAPWNIAAAYKISLDELYALNSLTPGSFIYPGDKLIIKLASATATPAESAASPTPSASPTKTPSPRPRTSTPAALAAADTSGPRLEGDQQADQPRQPSALANPNDSPDPLLVAIAALMTLGIGLLFLGSILNRRA